MRPPAEDFTYYPHPYHGFPIILSHVHSCFVICNSGSKLEANLFQWQKGYEMSKDDLVKLQAIWNSWRHVVPMQEFIKKITRPKRKATAEQDSPTPKSFKQRTSQGSGVWLDDETLHEFNQQLLSHDDVTVLKKQWILDWLSDFLELGCMVKVKGKLESDINSDDTMIRGDGCHEDIAFIGEFIKKTSEGGDPDIKDNKSNKTTPHCMCRSTHPKRKATGEQDSFLKSFKQRTFQGSGVWLDDKTLHEFDRQLP
ncbi:hypothetical protein BYT27DRAFT_7250201 [Phlegmacium glaucopus]|nr:hypothetical protein BYT27DRAFT_7250201 [Phlegmacium glaucopus]